MKTLCPRCEEPDHPCSRSACPEAERRAMPSAPPALSTAASVRQDHDALRKPWILTLCLTLVLLTSGACSSRSFVRETDTSGSFRIEATSFLFLACFEVPFDPKIKAMELANDTWAENLNITRTYSWPNWGFFSFLNGLVIGFRGTVIEGDYGIPPVTPEGRAIYDAAQSRRAHLRDPDGSAITPSVGTVP